MRHLKKLLLLILLLPFSYCKAANNEQAILQLIKRILPTQAKHFVVQYINQDQGKDVYELESKNGKIILRGNNNTSIAVAFNHYLKHYCHASTSWTGNQLQLPQTLPLVKPKVHISSPYPHRFMYNYCTFSYSMAFWDWKRWEQEIDWMALHGVNLPLAIVGQEVVWQNTLKQFGYTDAETKMFICGPAFNAWWLMGNLEGWGGPVPQSWINGQSELQKKILQRMRALGMEPVLQGFYGMVPSTLKKKFPNAQVHDTGKWLGFQRPGMLLPSDTLFAKMAKVYYEEQAKLYGANSYFQGDPFHEGGIAKGVDVTAAAKGIYASMDAFKPGAIWVLQAWQNNPRPDLLKGIPIGKALVTDLMSEARPQWGGVPTSMWHRKDGYQGHAWMYSEIPNFGGRTGMTGKLDATNQGIIHALHHPMGINSMKGIAATPEAIEQDGVLYDLIFDMAWQKDTLNMQQWLKTYTYSRYGKANQQMDAAWNILRQTVYNSNYHGDEDPPFETILCSRPGWNKTKTSSWGMGTMDYNPAKLFKAWQLTLQAAPALKNADTYRYDLVNITRQVLDNYGRTLYAAMQKAFEGKDKAGFERYSAQFLALLDDQNTLLATRKEFLLGTWLEMAKQKGTTLDEKKLYEWNARALITTWTHELNDVNDYSYREWSGLIKDYYLPRWQLFVAHTGKQLKGENSPAPNYFKFEEQWTKQQNNYQTQPQGDAVKTAKHLYDKYATFIVQSIRI